MNEFEAIEKFNNYYKKYGFKDINEINFDMLMYYIFNEDIKNSDLLLSYYSKNKKHTELISNNYKKKYNLNIINFTDIKFESICLYFNNFDYDILEYIITHTNCSKKEQLEKLKYRFNIDNKYLNIKFNDIYNENYKENIDCKKILYSKIYNINIFNLEIKKYNNINNYDIYFYDFFRKINKIFCLDLLILYINKEKTIKEISNIYSFSTTYIKRKLYEGYQIVIYYLESNIGIYSIKELFYNKNYIDINYFVFNKIIKKVIIKTLFYKAYNINIECICDFR